MSTSLPNDIKQYVIGKHAEELSRNNPPRHISVHIAQFLTQEVQHLSRRIDKQADVSSAASLTQQLERDYTI